MSEAISGEITEQRTRQEYAEKIMGYHWRTVEGFLGQGEWLIRAKRGLRHGQFMLMVESDLDYGIRKVENLMKIAMHPELANSKNWSHLPAVISTLHILSLLPSAEIIHQISINKINPNLRALDAARLLPVQEEAERADPPAVPPRLKLTLNRDNSQLLRAVVRAAYEEGLVDRMLEELFGNRRKHRPNAIDLLEQIQAAP